MKNIIIAVGHFILENFVRPVLHWGGMDLVLNPNWVPENKRDWSLMAEYRDLIIKYSPDEDCQNETPKIIWWFWWQGVNQAPPIVTRCLESVRKFMAEDYEIVVLDKDNVEDFITVDDVIKKKHNCGIINHTHFSEYVRVKLLSERGGIWIDATVFLSGRIPTDILSANFFIFKSGPFSLCDEIPPDESYLPAISTFANGSGHLLPSTWFLVARRGSPIHALNVKFLEQYWRRENRQYLYFIQHVFITYAICVNEHCRHEFMSAPCYLNFKPHYLMFRREERFDSLLLAEIFDASNIHKMTYKYKPFNGLPDSFLGKLLDGVLLQEAQRRK